MNDYQFREWLGRTALKDLQIKDLFPKKYNISYTGDYYCVYDAYTKGNNDKPILIEIKVRDRQYDDYMLEYNKCRDLCDIARNNLYLKENEMTFLYVCFCIEGTYIWNINHYVFNYDTIDWEGDKKDDKKFNKSTCKSREDKVTKKHIMLNPKDGKIIKYRINRNQLIKEEKERLFPKAAPKPCIFD